MKEPFVVGVLLVTVLFFGCCSSTAPSTAAPLTSTPQAQPQTNTANVCPSQGFMESDTDYCIDMCLVGKSDAQVYSDTCTKLCEQINYGAGSRGLKREIQNFKCKKCGDCTEAQIAEINASEEAAQISAKAMLNGSCASRCILETVKIDGCDCPSSAGGVSYCGDTCIGGRTYCAQNEVCANYQNKCIVNCINGNFTPYNNTK